MSFFGEFRRRNVDRVGIAYLAAVWVLIEVADTLVSIINAPAWIPQVLVYSAALGFPLALVLAWFYELTPEGIKATADVESVDAVKFTGRKVDFAIIGLLVIAVGFLLVRSPLEDQTTVLSNSVAVLPFDNLSPDPDNAYFAAGLHEEILNQLAKLSALNIIARTSVLSYGEDKPPIAEIAAALNVETVIEGSVRYAGNRIRVTAQLIAAESGVRLWSETYDREFADVFAIESEIAMNVANAMQVEFSVEEQDNLEKLPTSSPAAHAFYLRALASSRRTGQLPPELDRAIEIDPSFALAHAMKAETLSSRLNFSAAISDPEEAERRARESALRALELDPTLGIAHSALAGVAESNWQWREARQHSEEAYRLSPNDIGVIGRYGRILRNSGRFEEAIEVLRRGTALDPNTAFSFQQLGITYNYVGRYDLAATALGRALELSLQAGGSGIGNTVNLALAEVNRSNTGEALRLLQTAEELMDYRPNQPFRYGQMGIAYARLGRREDAQRLFDALVERANEGDIGDANWAIAHVALGEYDEARERLEAAMEKAEAVNYTALIMMKLNEWSDPVLEEPRFRQVLGELWSE